jgi:hypothetical protein
VIIGLLLLLLFDEVDEMGGCDVNVDPDVDDVTVLILLDGRSESDSGGDVPTLLSY